MFILRVVLLLILFSTWLAASPAELIHKGTSVEEVLRLYQTRGMKLLYSSRLVHPAMIVQTEPKSGSPRVVLDEVLRAYGLKISSGPAGTMLVVKDERRSPYENPVTRMAFEEQLEVPFVTIYITAKDKDNRFLTNLKAEDFILKEDGVEQRITEFTNFSDSVELPEEAEPLGILMLIDSSASMNDLHAGKRKYDLVRDAALRLIDQVHPPDQVMMMGFNQDTWVIHELTTDQRSIQEKLNAKAELGGRTALYDVLIQAVKQMQKFPGRRVLVLCSDGMDSASKTTLDELLRYLQSSDVTIFVLGTDDRRDFWHKGRDVLKKISAATAGYSFVSSSDSELNSSIDKIRMTLRSQYAAGYVPPSPTIHKWRKIKIECRIPDVKLSYRSQYLF